MTTMAYDFGNEIHIIELNELGAHDGSPATVFDLLPEGRDATLEAAGFRSIGRWSMQDICEGIEVTKS